MSDLRIIEDTDSGECVYVNAGIAFGPVMKSRDHANKFHEWLGLNPRQIEQLTLTANYTRFQAEAVCRYCGEIRPDLDYDEPMMKGYRHTCYECDRVSTDSARDRAAGI